MLGDMAEERLGSFWVGNNLFFKVSTFSYAKSIPYNFEEIVKRKNRYFISLFIHGHRIFPPAINRIRPWISNERQRQHPMQSVLPDIPKL